ncbi:hypothetical protein BXY47_3259 [Dietzia kunjamensis]|uniref:hypothetical protein n=1 Tax=Dietzia kunjamensis TaxID=322509 RepID=UPI000E7703D1|nr:hypothetical protein [Dietzia kunjamensis]MBB1012281.1 hypothetical protein [Dietzia kunjamensis]RKE55166.1 hypothetical protein BXY47_3259 [Dietzia kunjamensis]
MRSQRPRPASGRRLAGGFAALAATVAVAGCTATGPGSGDAGPPRLTPNPRHDVAAEMVEGRPAPEERLNACDLLDLTTEEIIDLTGADMPEVAPTGSGDLGLLCTYGGPGSPERYEAGLAGTSTTDAEATDTDADAAEVPDTGSADTEVTEGTEGTEGTGAETTADESATTSATTATTTPPAFDPDVVPDTVAAGVVTPRDGAKAALAGQATLLGARYACSEVRGPGAAEAGLTAPGEPGAPAAVGPRPATMYIDCVAAPTGGGVEVHTILVSGDELWHITMLRPETPRSPQTEASALAGLHRVAQEIVG